MKKIVLTICILIGIYFASQAQFSISPQVSPAFPVGPVNNYVDTGIGFGAEATYTINDQWRIGAAINRYHFNLDIQPFGFDLGNFIDLENILGNLNFDFNIVPITGTVQYILPGGVILPYVGVEAGVYNISARGFGLDITRSYFGLAPAIGVLYPMNDRLDLYANTKVQTVFVKESVPVLKDNLDEYLLFIPINVGVSFKFNQ